MRGCPVRARPPARARMRVMVMLLLAAACGASSSSSLSALVDALPGLAGDTHATTAWLHSLGDVFGLPRNASFPCFGPYMGLRASLRLACVEALLPAATAASRACGRHRRIPAAVGSCMDDVPSSAPPAAAVAPYLGCVGRFLAAVPLFAGCPPDAAAVLHTPGGWDRAARCQPRDSVRARLECALL